MRISGKAIYRKILHLIGFFSAILICIGVCLWYMVFVPARNEARCGFNLANVGRDIGHNYEGNFLFVDNTPYFKDELAVSSTFDKKRLVCPVCHKPYVYNPVSPSGERIMSVRYEEKDKDNFIMWCPDPCHKGQRSFLHASLYVSMISDSEVSWYYQKLATDLRDDEELKKENEFRLSQGMKPLKK